MKIIEYQNVTSTNTELSQRIGECGHGDTIVAYAQTAGRGQRGNSWESEPGKNLTFSTLLRPHDVAAKDSFLISMAVSVAMVHVLNSVATPAKIEIKWPNDIYCKDEKLAGILIENSFTGRNINHSIVGIGLNVNQKEFRSDAPNPVSLTMITGKEYELLPLLRQIVEAIVEEVDKIKDENFRRSLLDKYYENLWRREGEYYWKEADGREFKARLKRVEPSGELVLEDLNGEEKSYMFKEVFPVMTSKSY